MWLDLERLVETDAYVSTLVVASQVLEAMLTFHPQKTTGLVLSPMMQLGMTKKSVVKVQGDYTPELLTTGFGGHHCTTVGPSRHHLATAILRVVVQSREEWVRLLS